MKKEKKKQLVIFDMDGVLIESEPVHIAVHRKLAGEMLGLPHDAPDGEIEEGVSARECYRRLLVANGYAGEVETVLDVLDKKHFPEMVHMLEHGRIGLSAGTADVLAMLWKKGIDLAVASSSERMFVENVLAYFGIERYFLTVVAGRDVGQKKPAPDSYHEALKRAGIRAENALAIEDSMSGLQAATKAGIDCLWYRPDRAPMPDPALAHITTMKEILDYI